MTIDLKASFEALGKDAAIWDDASGVLSDAQREASTIHVYRGAFSFAAMDVADSYIQLSAQVLELLAQGVVETQGIATTLRAVRDDFQRQEDYNQSEYSSMWQPADY